MCTKYDIWIPVSMYDTNKVVVMEVNEGGLYADKSPLQTVTYL